MIQTIRTVPLGDMQAVYRQSQEGGAVELQLLPAQQTPPPDGRRRRAVSLVQAHTTGSSSSPGSSSVSRAVIRWARSSTVPPAATVRMACGETNRSPG